jgi:hypothetical protein
LNAVAIINNIEKDIKPEFSDALKSKNADYILWSERESQHSKQLISA